MVTKKTNNPNKVKQGKKNRKSGSEWERKVREDLESKGWIVDRWGNNVEFINVMDYGQSKSYEDGKVKKIGRLIQAKAKYNPFTKSLMMSKGGFPDFISFKYHETFTSSELKDVGYYGGDVYVGIGVECKSNGYLDPEEREKCKWLIENKIFSKIMIAKKKKEGRKIIVEYVEFQE